MSKLAFVAVSAEADFDPVLAHLCLELSLITFLRAILNRIPLLLMPAPSATPSSPPPLLSTLAPTVVRVYSLLEFTLLYQHSR
jgi:hypothetical protein